MRDRRIGKLCEEDVLTALNELSGHLHRAADRSLPERQIEHMMQAKRDQGTLDDAEDQRTDIAGARHQTAQRIDAILHHWPDEEHQDAYKDEHDRGNDRYEPAAAKERQRIRQLDLVKAIMQRGYAQTDDDAAEHAHLQCLDAAHRCDRPLSTSDAIVPSARI